MCAARARRDERVVETADIGKGVARLMRTYANRVGAADIEELAALWEIREGADAAMVTVVDGLLARGFTWTEMARRLGIRRQSLTAWRDRRRAADQAQIPAAGIAGGEGRAAGRPSVRPTIESED
jgi:hypothetical protein